MMYWEGCRIATGCSVEDLISARYWMILNTFEIRVVIFIEFCQIRHPALLESTLQGTGQSVSTSWQVMGVCSTYFWQSWNGQRCSLNFFIFINRRNSYLIYYKDFFFLYNSRNIKNTTNSIHAIYLEVKISKNVLM